MQSDVYFIIGCGINLTCLEKGNSVDGNRVDSFTVSLDITSLVLKLVKLHGAF